MACQIFIDYIPHYDSTDSASQVPQGCRITLHGGDEHTMCTTISQLEDLCCGVTDFFEVYECLGTVFLA